MAVRTQKAYVRAVYELAKYYRRRPDRFTDQELKNNLYYLTQEKKLSPNSIN